MLITDDSLNRDQEAQGPIRRERLAVWRHSATLLAQLIDPAPESGFSDTHRLAGFCHAIALVDDQGRCIMFELDRKGSTLFAH